MMSDYSPSFKKCPRCGSQAFEKLRTHSHCSECLYSEDSFYEFESSYNHAKRIEKELNLDCFKASVTAIPLNKSKRNGEAS
jgi:ribosomal protein L37E